MESKERHYNKITFFILFALFIIVSICCLNSCKKGKETEPEYVKHNLEFRLTSNGTITSYSWNNGQEAEGGGLWVHTFSYYCDAYTNGMHSQTFTFEGRGNDTLKLFVLVDNIEVRQTTGIDSVKTIFVYE